MSAQVKPEAFRRTIDGSQVDLYTLKSMDLKLQLQTTIVVSLTVPDGNGKLGDVLNCDTLNDYIGNAYFGSLIGRYGNRIARQIHVDGVSISLRKTTPNSLHGGRRVRQSRLASYEKVDGDRPASS